MAEPPSFTDAIREIARELGDPRPTHGKVNRASSRIDHWGRRLHGLGYLRAREIAAGLTAALAELDRAHALPDETRAEAARRAAGHLESAREHAAAGFLPQPAAAVPEES